MSLFSNISLKGPLSLIILDGWGLASESRGNAIFQAKTPNFKSFLATFPQSTLLASGESVGLPKGEPGNSETGHLNLGTGKIVYQDLPRINFSIADGSFFRNTAFLNAIVHAKKFESNLHLMGLVGSGGVHSSVEHLYALIKLAAENNFKNVFLHLFTDGRDSAPTSSLSYLKDLELKLKDFGLGKISTICGRYFAMDRDNRWERIQIAYEALTSGIGVKSKSFSQTIENFYQENTTDEFIKPIILLDDNNNPVKLIGDNDAVIFFNFRIDRPRELTKAFVFPDFEKYCPKKASFDPYAERYGHKQFEEFNSIKTFSRKKILKNLFFVTMTQYEEGLPAEVAFPPSRINLPLSRVFAERGKRQFHISETEKYPHITNFFDGLSEKPFPFEEWSEIPSSKVATYDLKPEMSAEMLTEQFLKRYSTEMYSFSLINFANPDMVAHTGNLPATIKACETVDYYLGIIVKKILSINGTAIITADHGNAEELINLDSGEINTEHSKNPVPLIIINKAFTLKKVVFPQGILADVAPTILSLLRIPIPSEMTGRPILK